MATDHPDPSIALPPSWRHHICSGVLYALCLARLVCGSARGWAAEQLGTRVRLRAESESGPEQIGPLREEIHIKDACAKPVTLAKGQPGARVDMEVEFLADRKHLPIVRLQRAA
jgi:hypothetical protein